LRFFFVFIRLEVPAVWSSLGLPSAPPPPFPFLRGALRTHTNTRRKSHKRDQVIAVYCHCCFSVRLLSLLLAPPPGRSRGVSLRGKRDCVWGPSPSLFAGWLACLLACCTQYSHTRCFSTDNRMIQNVGVDSLGCLVFLCLPASLYKWDRLGGRNAADYQLPDPFNFPLKLRTCALCLLSDSLCRSFTELRPFHGTMHPPVHPSIHPLLYTPRQLHARPIHRQTDWLIHKQN